MEQLKKSTETINAGVSGNVECKILIDATQFSKNNLKGKDTPIKVVALNRTTTNACKAAMTKPGSQYKNNTYGVNSVVGASPWHTKNSSSVNGTVAEVKEDRLATKFVTKTIKGKKVKVASGAKYITSSGFYVYTNGKGAKRTVSSYKTKATKQINNWRLTANELKRLKDNAHTKAYPIPTITYHNDTNDKYDILTIKNAKKGENYTIDLVYDKMNVISMTEVTATKNGNMEFNIKSSKIPSLWKKICGNQN